MTFLKCEEAWFESFEPRYFDEEGVHLLSGVPRDLPASASRSGWCAFAVAAVALALTVVAVAAAS
jgi:hypothetical protein